MVTLEFEASVISNDNRERFEGLGSAIGARDGIDTIALMARLGSLSLLDRIQLDRSLVDWSIFGSSGGSVLGVQDGGLQGLAPVPNELLVESP